MTDISPIGRTPGAALQPPTRAGAARPPQAPAAAPTADRVEVSPVATYLAQLAELPDVRQDLVDRVRQEIANGNYDTPDKLDALLDELAEDLR